MKGFFLILKVANDWPDLLNKYSISVLFFKIIYLKMKDEEMGGGGGGYMVDGYLVLFDHMIIYSD